MNMPQGYVQLNNHTLLITLVDGIKLFVDSRDISIVPHLLVDGYWERWVTGIWVNVVKTGNVVLDIGSHVGYYSFLAARIVGPTGRVIAFEPNPRHHANFLRSIFVNGWEEVVRLVPAAVSNRSGFACLRIPGELTGSASIVSANFAKLPRHAIFGSRHIIVRKIGILRFLQRHRLEPDVIKLDVEGAEALILPELLSLYRFVQKPVEIIVEFTPNSWEKLRVNPERIFAEFVKTGFCIHAIRHDGTLAPLSVSDVVNGNIPEIKRHGFCEIKLGRG